MDMKAAVAHMVETVKLAIEKRCAPLEGRIAELEASPLEYTGVHEVGKTYRRGQFATHAGGVWACQRTTAQRPGDSNAWILAVKAGRDGKDAR